MQSVTELNGTQVLTRQRREWTIQRIGWIVMALTLLAGVLGLLGGGGILNVRVAGEEGSPIWAEHERLVRIETPTTLQVHLLGGASGEVSMWMASDYLAHVEVRQIMPEPDSVTAEPERVVFTFQAAPSDRPVVIAFSVQPDDPGPLNGEIGRPDGPAVRFSQMVLP